MSTPMSSNNNSGTGSRAASLRGFVRGRHRILRGLSAVATVAMTSLVSIGVVAVTSAPANAASTCTQNISGTTIPNITQFQFFNSERTMLQGPADGLGAVYLFSHADVDGLYDVKVTTVAVSNPVPAQMFTPSEDRETGIAAGVTYMFNPSWDYNDSTTPKQFANSQTFKFEFFLTGTNTPATLNVMANTMDNDGAQYVGNGVLGAQITEFVKYETLPDSWMKSSTSLLTQQADGLVPGNPTTNPGVSAEPRFSISGIYNQISTFTWTQGNTVDDFAVYGGSSERAGALSMMCEPAMQGVANAELALDKVVTSPSPIVSGQNVTYTLTPRNEGYASMPAGWTVTDLLPAGLTPVSMSGTGYTCTASVCTSNVALPALSTGNPITVTATVTAAGGSLKNVAYISPTAGQPAETIPLGTIPTTATDTTASTTNNDAQAIIDVQPADPKIQVVKRITGVTDNAPVGTIGAGDVINYSFTVTNTGNVTLAPVRITDSKLNLTDAACVASLAPGASATCSTVGSYTIQSSDVLAGGVVNTATASGTAPGGAVVTDVSDTGTVPNGYGTVTTVPTPGNTESPIPGTVTTTVPNTADPGDDPTVLTLEPPASIQLVKSITSVTNDNPDNVTGVGDVVHYSFTVTNTGLVALTNVTVTDAKLGISAAPCVASLAPGATATCTVTGAYTIQYADLVAGGVVNSATTTGTTPAGLGIPNPTDVSDTGTAPTAPGAFISVGSNEITETAIPGTVTTTVPNSAADPTSDPTVLTLNVPDPKIALNKVAGAPTGNTVGSTITYTFVVTNTGNVTLDHVALTDPVVGAITCPKTILIPGESMTCTAAPYALTQADLDAGHVANIATTTGNPPNGDPLVTTDDVKATDSTDTSITASGGIQLVKSAANVVDAVADGFTGGPGDTITYTFKVTNTGGLTLTPVTITDTKLGLTDAACVASLAPGATATCTTTATYTITAADYAAHGVVNTATATGTTQLGGKVTDVSDTGTAPSGPNTVGLVVNNETAETAIPGTVTTTVPNSAADPTSDPTVVTLPTADPSILLDKVAGDLTGAAVGDTITYTFTVTNDGNVALDPVSVSDPLLGTITCAATSLAVGASTTCTAADYALTQDDINAGHVANTATATGVPPTWTGVTEVTDDDSTDTPVTPNPSIQLIKSITSVQNTVDDGLIGPGDTVKYSFSVTNTGNVTLAPVTVTDTKLGLSNAACVASLAPGATATCSTTGSYVLTLADVNAGGVVNTATATGTPPAALDLDPVTDVSDTATIPNGPGATSPVNNPTGTESAIPGTVTTTVPNSSADPTEDPTVLTLAAPKPSIQLVKSITGVQDTVVDGLIGAGDTVTYSFTVTNTGNVTLAPVTVSDVKLSISDAACVASLAPGASALCTTTASYVLTADDVKAGGVVNTAITKGLPPAGYNLPAVSDVSDTGTAPDGPGDYADVVDPAGTETPIPGTVTTTVPNDGTDKTEDPTVLTLATPKPAIELVKSISKINDVDGDGFIGINDTVEYTFSVTNTGNVLLAPVTISDSKLGLTNAACVDSLAVGVTATCSTVATYTLKTADIDNGGVLNTATATGTPPAAFNLDPVTDVSDTGTAPDAPGSVTDVEDPAGTETVIPDGVTTAVTNDPNDSTEDPTVVTLLQPKPAISLIKSITKVEDTVDDGIIGAGDTVTYSFTVTNTGNVVLKPVTISDDTLGLTDAACVDSLAVGASATCSTTGSYELTAADVAAGGIVNTATTTGIPPVSTGIKQVTDTSDTGTVPNGPGVVSTVDAPETVESEIPAGVTTDIENNPKTPAEDPTVLTLATPVAEIELVKSITDVEDTIVDGLIGAGDTVTYSFTVTNTGNVTLAPVTVSDVKLSVEDAACADSLAPGATVVCSTTATYVLTGDDVRAGGVVNTATTTGTAPDWTKLGDVTDVSDTGTQPNGNGVVAEVNQPGVVETAIPGTVTTTVPNDAKDPTEDPTVLTLATPKPEISLVKSITKVTDVDGDGFIGIDDTVEYSFSVTNTGNVLLAPVTVSDAKLGLTDAACVDSLAVGATATCSTTKTYALTAADIAAGGVVNTAVATGTPPAAFGLDPVTDTSDTGTAPDGPGGFIEVTDPTGTETMIPEGVTTDVPNDPKDTTEDPTVLSLLIPKPSIVLVKSITHIDDTVADGLIGAGDTLTYSFTVTNTGNVLLKPVTISDVMLGLDAAPCADSLPIGETVTCTTTADYVITAADVKAGGVANTAITTGVPPISTGIKAVTDVSDTGTEPAGPGDVAEVDSPESTESEIPGTVKTDLTNDGTDPGEDPTVMTLAEPTPKIELIKAITKVEDTVDDGLITAGDTVSYSFTVTNTGNVLLAPVTISDVKLGLDGAACADSLPVGETVTCTTTGSYVLQAADVLAHGVVNTATTTGIPPAAFELDPVTDVSDTGTAPNGDGKYAPVDDPTGTETAIPGTVTTEVTNDGTDKTEDPTVLTLTTPNPKISLIKSITGVKDLDGNDYIGIGDEVSYKFVVTNTGNVTLAPVTITDEKLGLVDAACVDSLKVGASATCETTATYALTVDDVNAGGVVNTAIATGTPPVLTGIKSVTDTSDTGTAPDGPGAYTDVTEPESAETAIPGTVTTEVTNDPADKTEDPTVLTLIVPEPRIELVKWITKVNDVVDDGIIGAGDTVEYSFKVTNTGNVTLAPVTVSDEMLGLSDAACVDSLAVGATATCSTTATYELTADDVLAGGVANTAITTGTPPVDSGKDPVTDTSDTGTAPESPGKVSTVDSPESTETAIPSSVTTQVTNDGKDPGEDPTVLTLAIPSPAIDLVKSADTEGPLSTGDIVNYTFTVTNTGNVTLHDIVVTDDMVGEVTCEVTTLKPGESTTCTAAPYTVTLANFEAGTLVNNASVTGTAPDETTVTDPDDLVIPTSDPTPSIRLVKRADDRGPLKVGDKVAFSFVVTNTGNVTLHNVKVTDPMVTGITCPATTLAPGASMTCTSNLYTVTEKDVKAKKIVNVAVAQGTPPKGKDVKHTDTITIKTEGAAVLPAAGSPVGPHTLWGIGGLLVAGTTLLLTGRRRRKV